MAFTNKITRKYVIDNAQKVLGILASRHLSVFDQHLSRLSAIHFQNTTITASNHTQKICTASREGIPKVGKGHWIA